MKRAIGFLAIAAAFGLLPSAANASVITTQTFCVAGSNPAGESASCPTGLGATLSISDTNLALNQYDVTLTLDATAAAGITNITQVQFDLSGIAGNEYDSKPTLDTSGVDGGATWTVFFDNVNNGGGCSADNLNTAHVCAAGSGTGTDGGDINTWVFHIDLIDSLPALTSAIDTNLRAVFLPNGILSPDFNNIPDTTTPGGGNDTPGTPGTTPTTPGSGGDTSVPEPTSLILLGSGLAYVSTRLRRRAE